MIGADIPRVDARAKATGAAEFTTDLPIRHPNALFIKALRSPYAHARIALLDCAEARSLPGVEYILTGSEPGVDWQRFPPQARMAQGETLWAGQAVALVAARSREVAEEALSRIRVCYHPLPHVLSWQESFQEHPVSVIDPGFTPEVPDTQPEFNLPNVSGSYRLVKGNVDEAFADADIVLEGEFWTGKKSHNQLERAAALAVYEPEGAITLYCNGCGVHAIIKSMICDLFGLPQSKVRVIQPYIGGSFGNRNSSYMEAPAVLMALKTRRTVYYEYTREEMFTASPSNWSCATRIRMGAKRDGTITVKDLRLIEEVGAVTGKSPNTGRMSSSSAACVYNIPNTRMNTCSLRTNTVPAGAYRGLGAPDAAFALESMLNRLARELKISPLELRLKNLLEKGQMDDYGGEITSIGLRECLHAVAKAIEINKPCLQHDPLWRKGKGIACVGKQNGPRTRSEAEVLVHSDGCAELRVSCDNHGMGASTTLTQIAAAELNISPDRIRVVVSDTAVTPFDNNSASSSGIYRTGNAVRFACRDAVAQLKEAAARAAGVHPHMVTIQGGSAVITGSHIKEIPIAELFSAPSPFRQDIHGLLQGTPVRGHGIFCPAPTVPWDENGRTPRMWNWFQYAATAVEIAVNVETGQIKVLRVATAADTGNPISPKIIEGQIDGGILMAMGFCLQEEHLYNRDGAIANSNLSDYRLPLMSDLPHRENLLSFLCPDPLPDGPYGAKGMSEAVVGALAPAIADALYQAAGIEMNCYPMTPERVLKALKRRDKSHA